MANGRDEGVTKLLFDDFPEAHPHGKILDSDMIGMAAEVAHGCCAVFFFNFWCCPVLMHLDSHASCQHAILCQAHICLFKSRSNSWI